MAEKKPITKKWWFWAGIVLIVIIIAGRGSGDDKTSQNADNDNPAIEATATPEIAAENDPTPTPEPTPEPTPDVPIFFGGTYKIGEDMAPGEYRLFTYYEHYDTPGYFEVTSDSSGRFESIILNDDFYNFTYITVNFGQYLTFDDARAIAMDDVSPYEPEDNTYVQGTYLVGFDIPAGEYEVTASRDTGGYWERSSDSSHSPDSIIANDNFEDSCYVTINDGEYFKIAHAYIEVN